MISIVKATAADFETISDIANKTWPSTYGNILSKDQLTYMLESFYSIDGLTKNIEDKHHFLLAKESETVLGFASYVDDYTRIGLTRIPKIYMVPESQGKGVGKLFIRQIEILARENGADALTLNVNRYNNALGFYQKLGFEIVREENIELEHGYLMEDYVMEMKLP